MSNTLQDHRVYNVSGRSHGRTHARTNRTNTVGLCLLLHHVGRRHKTLLSYPCYLTHYTKLLTSKPFCRKETARCRSCSFRCKVRRQHSLQSHVSELQTYRRETEFNAKWRYKVIQSHVFWSQWKGDKALSIYNIIILALFVNVSKPTKDPQFFREF